MFRDYNRSFFKKWSPEMAYVLGFFASDGTMIHNSRGACFIEFNSTDKSIIFGIRKALSSEHKISARQRKNLKWKIGYRLQIGSKEYYEDLLGLGFTPNKSNKLKYPNVPDKYFTDFVRGYFDGDGSVYFRKHWIKSRNKKRWVFSSRFISGSKPFLEDLLRSLRRAGLQRGFIIAKKRGYELAFSHHDSLALFKLMYQNVLSGLYIPRKFKTFRKAVGVLLKEAEPKII